MLAYRSSGSGKRLDATDQGCRAHDGFRSACTMHSQRCPNRTSRMGLSAEQSLAVDVSDSLADRVCLHAGFHVGTHSRCACGMDVHMAALAAIFSDLNRMPPYFDCVRRARCSGGCTFK